MPNPFTTAARDARQRGSVAAAARITMEGTIARHLITTALAEDMAISVNDGEDTVLVKSRAERMILDAMFSTDADWLIFWKPGSLRPFGRVYLVYGNTGYDVISDYSSNDLDAFSAWMKPIEDFAEEIERKADASADVDEDESEEA